MQRREVAVSDEKEITEMLQHLSVRRKLSLQHVLLFIAILKTWSRHDFHTPFAIHTGELMKDARIKSRLHYNKCMHDLSECGLFLYTRDQSPLKGSMVHLRKFFRLRN